MSLFSGKEARIQIRISEISNSSSDDSRNMDSSSNSKKAIDISDDPQSIKSAETITPVKGSIPLYSSNTESA
jgi:hypothetical protein